MNHRIALPILCAAALLTAACNRPTPQSPSPEPATTPPPVDPAVDPATPQAVPVPEGSAGAVDGSTPPPPPGTTTPGTAPGG